jgi:hypothetical protein
MEPNPEEIGCVHGQSIFDWLCRQGILHLASFIYRLPDLGLGCTTCSLAYVVRQTRPCQARGMPITHSSVSSGTGKYIPTPKATTGCMHLPNGLGTLRRHDRGLCNQCALFLICQTFLAGDIVSHLALHSPEGQSPCGGLISIAPLRREGCLTYHWID